MEWTFDALERRVLSVLIEKALTQPDYYPMTPNAVVAGCNQKSNRNPVMDVAEDEVWEVLERLRGRGLMSMVLPPPGARTNRFKHEVEGALGWTPREQAVMAELMLRGPQTVGELRTRCSRMASFEDLQVVGNVLAGLAEREPSLVAVMAREPGRSAVRHTHLLYPEDEQPEAGMADQTSGVAVAAPAAAGATGLASRVAALEADVAELREAMAHLRGELGIADTSEA